MQQTDILKRENVSLWLKDGLSSQIPVLKEDLSCDVCVVGAGITGITTACRLHEEGLSVVLLDKQEPVHLASGNTTAKFTFQHDLIYHDIIKERGKESAKFYHQAQSAGMAYVRTLIEQHGIACDFAETAAMVYAETDERMRDLWDEESAYKQLGIPHALINEVPLGIKGIGALKVDGQFALHPVKYLDFLLSFLIKEGVPVFQHTKAKGVEEEGGQIKLKTEDGHLITCRHLVEATAYPFFGGDGMYFTRLEGSRSYLTAFPLAEKLNDKIMMISEAQEPFSIRFSDTDGVFYLLVGGQGHKMGQAESEREDYLRLIEFARTNFNAGEAAFRWSAQDYRTLDGVPYIGRVSSKRKNIYVATGFNKWGMSNGSFAALLLTDLIMGTQSRFEALFEPSRGEVKSNLGTFFKANLNVAKEFVKGKVMPEELSVDQLKPDEGGIVKLNGKRVAAYRDETGKLHLSDSTCTHMGCELVYNDAERTFDCPCHASRFTYDGKVIEGPAMSDLKKVETEQ